MTRKPYFIISIINKLKAEGYTVKESVDIPFQGSFTIINFVAEKNKKTLAIVINASEKKLAFLRTKFSEVRSLKTIEVSEEKTIKHLCGHVWAPITQYPKECPKCKIKIPLEAYPQVQKNDTTNGRI